MRIDITGGVCRTPEYALRKPIDLHIESGQQVAIVGDNGSGKTLLTDILRSRHSLQIPWPRYDFGEGARPYVADNIRYIAFRDSYGSVDGSYSYDLRWNSTEIDPETPLAGSLVDEAYRSGGEDTEARRLLRDRIAEAFHLRELMDKPVVLLSSGELRRLVLTRALLSGARLLIIDNPYIGLDADTRQQFTSLLSVLASQPHLLMVPVVSRVGDVPPFVTHVVEVSGRVALPMVTRQQYISRHTPPAGPLLTEEARREMERIPPLEGDYRANRVVEMHRVSICYGSRTILSDLDWTVMSGEHWALRGENGAGKSTLLSLVSADNPQSYSQDITLFDHRRGTGETIWEIKRHIGYVSPEMHRAYRRDLPALRIVASGLKDTVGLYCRPSDEDYGRCSAWMRVFGIQDLAERSFLSLSSGEQRLVLLARAFVKSPQLLILDEPLHGLDDRHRLLVKEIIDAYCAMPGKTLIMVTHYDSELPQCIDHELRLKKNL